MADGLAEQGREASAAESARAAAWDNWETPPRRPEIPVLHLDGFDGPMDLLLDLAERQRIDLGGLSILTLAEQFVDAMQRLESTVPIERRADWLVLATRLVLLRSRLLFPQSPAEQKAAEQDEAAEVRRLEQNILLRAGAAWLGARPQLGVDVFTRPAVPVASRAVGYVALIEACLVVLRGRAGQPGMAPVYRPAAAAFWRVSDALTLIRATLAQQPAGCDLIAFVPDVAAGATNRLLKARAAVASTLLAGLELARDGTLTFEQEDDFGLVRLAAALADNVHATVETLAG